jgi:hypothetical protein
MLCITTALFVPWILALKRQIVRHRNEIQRLKRHVEETSAKPGLKP